MNKNSSKKEGVHFGSTSPALREEQGLWSHRSLKIILQTAIVCCITIAVVAVGASSTTTLGSNISTGGTLTVTGVSTLTGAVTTGGAITVGTDLTVTGVSTLTGAVSAGGTLTVAGISTFNDSLLASSTLLTTGTATFYGNMVLGDNSADLILSTGGFYASSTLMATGATTLFGNTTIGDANTDTLTIRSGVWSLTSTATTTVAMTNGLNFDSNTFVIDPNSNRVGIGTTGPSHLLHILGTPPSSGYLTSVESSVADQMGALVYNNNSANSSSNAFLEVKTNGADSGNPFLSVTVAGQTNWVMGVKNSDSDKFMIGTSWGLSGAPFLTIDTTGNVGIGTTSPSAKFEVYQSGTGDILNLFDGSTEVFTIADGGKATLAASSTQYTMLSMKMEGTAAWTQVGGDAINSSWADATYEHIHDAVQYNGKLYAGLGSGTGDSEVWEWDGSSWTMVGGDGINSSWADATYERLWEMTAYNGNLYAGLGSSVGDAELWEYNGSSWTKVGGDGLNSSWADADFGTVESFAVLNGKLYVGLGHGTGDAEVWEWDSVTWTKVGGDSVNSSWDTSNYCYSLGTYNGKVYAGLGGHDFPSAHAEAEVWEYDGSSWTQIGGDTINSSWASNSYYYILTIKEYNNKLYIGAGLGLEGSGVYGDIWEYDGSSWTQIGGGGVNGSWADVEGEGVQDIEIYNGALYIAIAGSAGDAEVWKYNGLSWTFVGGDGTGWADSTYERVRELAVYNDKLYAVLGESTGEAEVWEYNSYETGMSKLADGLLIGSRFKFDSLGRLGINNLTPERELDVWGDIRIYNQTLDTFGGNVAIGDIATSTGAKLTVRQSSAGDIVNIFDGTTEIFTILDGGNVGIATTTPVYNLDVYGTARIFNRLASEADYDPIDDDLILYIPFSEGAGTAAYDRSKYGNDGSTFGGSPTWSTSGKLGNAISFDGTSDYVYIPYTASIDLTDKLTLEAWVKLTAFDTGYRTIVGKTVGSGGANSYELGYAATSHEWFFVIGSSTANTLVGETAATLDTWTHLVGAWDGSIMTLYVNGAFNASTTRTVIESDTHGITIGCDVNSETYNQNLNGVIDEVRIYNRVLSSDEARERYERGLGSQAPYTAIGSGYVGVATTTPATPLDVYTTATTTITIDSSDTERGSCMKLKDVDGGGYTYCYVLNGSMECSATSCE